MLEVSGAVGAERPDLHVPFGFSQKKIDMRNSQESVTLPVVIGDASFALQSTLCGWIFCRARDVSGTQRKQ